MIRRMACILALLACQAQAGPVPHYAVIDPLGAAARRNFDDAKIATLPSWKREFQIEGRSYRYRVLGAQPESGAVTAIPTLIVPIRLIVPDKSAVFDATAIVPHILASPLFTPALSGGRLQFADAMLRAEFPGAPVGWHTLLAPSVAPALEIAMPKRSVHVVQAASGNLFGYIRDSHTVNAAIGGYMRAHPDPGTMMVFITYNSVESFAFGYHSWRWGDRTRTSALVYMYSSWLEGVDDVLGFASPDAATLSHEIVETVHDPLITSVTRRWGDPFRRNRCFDTLIEVADAVENAPLGIVYAQQLGRKDGRPFLYTLQNTALLPWFTREAPSSAAGGAYSFPDPHALAKPAPLECAR
jgi:hypothetical protein